MIVMAIKHQVADYEAWKSVFDTYTPVSRGALFHRVNRAVDDPDTVLVVCGFRSADEASAFKGDAVLKEKMQAAGVTSAPRFEVYEQVATSEA
jgi:hypothetical protein